MTPKEYQYRGESMILDAEARAFAPGAFVDLPDGAAHYELAGPVEGQTVVLVHGFSVPYYIWDPTFEALVAAGFRVLRYDLYGRGFSARPQVPYDRDLFDRQLLDILPGLGLALPVDLIGLSMGGAISTTFTDRHPQAVHRLCLIAPVGLPQDLPFLAGLLSAPKIGEWIMDLFGDRFLTGSLADDLYDPEQHPEYQEQYLKQMQYQGFKRAILSTIRSGVLEDISATYERVGQQDRDVLLVWGRHDQTVPFDLNAQARKAIPGIEFHAIDEARHLPHYEQPTVVNPILVEFLNRDVVE